MDKKIICSLLGNILVAFTFTFAIPIIYAVTTSFSIHALLVFSLTGIFTGILGVTLARYGRNHKRRLPIFTSALVLLLSYPLIALIAMIPFLWSGWLFPFDAILETFSDVTSAGVSLLSPNAPYILRLWQSVLMWFGSLIFLIMLVTLMPDVGGSFGLSMSLQGGQLFSPLFGQMNTMAQRMIKVYGGLTILSFALFKAAGLNFCDALLMAMRCISTGGGDFFPSRGNFYVEATAIFSMLIACGNFLLYYRLIQTLPPPRTGDKVNFFKRVIRYVKRLYQNFFGNIKILFSNSEIQLCTLIIFFSVLFISVTILFHNPQLKIGSVIWYAFFHIVSYISTTGINVTPFDVTPDFDKFLVFLMAMCGGCMGSVTGGLKLMRVLVLFKTTAAELKKTIHPHMIPSVRVNQTAVPPQIVGRILGYFFLVFITLFVCAGILSFTGSQFSEAVGISAVCLTNVGSLPGIVDPEVFMRLSDAAKIFCSVILIVGRVEIFALFIVIAGLLKI